MDKKKYKKIGWALISLSLLISVYANYNCSFGCIGIWSKILNPLSIIGFILYILGTFFIFKKEVRNSSHA